MSKKFQKITKKYSKYRKKTQKKNNKTPKIYKKRYKTQNEKNKKYELLLGVPPPITTDKCEYFLFKQRTI